jgi:hypothetical protein
MVLRGALMKKILYGNSNFPHMIRGNGYYVDKTRYIAELEDLGADYLMFLRPRRFGKSLFISMLESYYDINKADEFDELFGELYIGKNPTEQRNSYYILKFNLSDVSSYGTIEQIEESFNKTVLGDIMLFYCKYESLTGGEKAFYEAFPSVEAAGDTFRRFITLMQAKQTQFYLLIDEYDNFANNILSEHGKEVYYSLTHGVGFLRNFFTRIKAGTDSKTVAKMFATGVSPLVMSDVTSGFNIDENISQDLIFNNMVGFNQEEVEAAVDYYIAQKVVPKQDRARMLEVMKTNYDGYLFSQGASESVHNSNSVLYLLNYYMKNKRMPAQIIDTKMITDYRKLQFLVLEGNQLNGNFKCLNSILQEHQVSAELIRNFAMSDLIELDKFVSFLYYLGFLTLVKPDIDRYIFSVPNEMCKTILWEYIRKTLEKVYNLKIGVFQDFMGQMTRDGVWEPFFKYTFEEFYKVSSNRDFIYREAGVKGFLLAYLNLSSAYLVYSEPELNKGYADIYISPNLNVFPEMCPKHFLVELKYIKQSEITPNTGKSLVENHVKQAKAQLEQYAHDSKLPKDTIKIVALTTNEELLALKEV